MAEPKAPQTITVIDPSGQYGTIDLAEAAQAQEAGFRIASPEEAQVFHDKEKYGEGGLNELKAGAAGAARGFTFGLSDVALTQSGAVDPETLAGLKEYNPAASLGGEAAGVVGGLFMPVGAIAKGVGLAAKGVAGGAAAREGALVASRLLNPVRAVSEGTQAISRAALPAAERLVGRVVSKEASPLVAKVLSQGAASAAGSAVEGAAYGLGQSVSEAALGDPDLNGEKVLSNIGIGALLGGALGATARTGGVLFEEVATKADSVAQTLAKRLHGSPVDAQPGSLPSAFEQMGAAPEYRESILGGFARQKPNAKAIQEASDTLGVQTFEGQISDSKGIQYMDSMLMNAHNPTPAALARQEAFEGAIRKVETRLGDALGESTNLSQVEVGNALKKSLTEQIEKEVAPISELYDTIRQYHTAIPLSPKSGSAIARNISRLDDVRLSKSSPQAGIARRVAEDLPGLKTVDDVKRYKTLLNDSLSPAASPAERRVVGQIAEKLSSLEESTILRFAKKEMKAGPAKEKIEALIGMRGEANASYRGLMEKVGELSEKLGKKRVRGVTSALEFIDDLTPEKVASRLFDKKDSEFLGWFSKTFPNEAGLLGQFQRSAIRDAALTDGKLQINNVLRQVDKLSPEVKRLLFSPEHLKTLDAAGTWMESLPKHFNPSMTSKGLGYADALSSPISYAVASMRDQGMKKLIEGFVEKTGGAEAQQLKTLIRMERRFQDMAQKIASGAKSAINATSKVSIAAATGHTRTATLEEKDYEKIATKLNEVAASPEAMTAALEQSTSRLYEVAPNTSGGVHMAMIRATGFLKSKLPETPKSTLLGPELKPSKSELAQFNRYFQVVKDPLEAFKQIESNSLTPETVETLQAVYPKLYLDMKAAVLDQITSKISKKTTIPYPKRIMLSLFLGQDLDPSTETAAIQSTQLAIASANQGQMQEQQASGPSQGGKKYGELSLSSQTLTDSQAAADRRNS